MTVTPFWAALLPGGVAHYWTPRYARPGWRVVCGQPAPGGTGPETATPPAGACKTCVRWVARVAARQAAQR